MSRPVRMLFASLAILAAAAATITGVAVLGPRFYHWWTPPGVVNVGAPHNPTSRAHSPATTAPAKQMVKPKAKKPKAHKTTTQRATTAHRKATPIPVYGNAPKALVDWVANRHTFTCAAAPQPVFLKSSMRANLQRLANTPGISPDWKANLAVLDEALNQGIRGLWVGVYTYNPKTGMATPCKSGEASVTTTWQHPPGASGRPVPALVATGYYTGQHYHGIVGFLPNGRGLAPG